MNTQATHRALQAFNYVVLALMLAAIIYAGWISLINWSGISV